MILEFMATRTFNQELQIDDPGHVALRGTNGDGEDYYFATYPDMGKVAVLKFGPVIADFDALGEEFHLEQKIIKYNQKTIEKEINHFANDFKSNISELVEVSQQELLDAMPTANMFLKPIAVVED